MLKVLRLDWFLLNGYNIIQIGDYQHHCQLKVIVLTQYSRYRFLQQLQVMQQQKTQPILDEINREVGSLSVDEQNVLAKQTYEAGFMAFLGTKFSSEYVNSPDGKVAAENLLATIRKSIYNLR